MNKLFVHHSGTDPHLRNPKFNEPQKQDSQRKQKTNNFWFSKYTFFTCLFSIHDLYFLYLQQEPEDLVSWFVNEIPVKLFHLLKIAILI